MIKLLDKYWPLLFIFSVWFIFSSPFFLKGKVPFPSNYQMNFFPPWSAYEKFWGPVKNNAMPDIITQIYPWRHFTIEQWLLGVTPLWNPYSFSGTPHLANYQSAVLSPFNFLFLLFKFVDAWSILVLLQSLLAGIFMYFFIRSLNNFSKPARLMSSVSFMFCGFITTWMGYATLAYAILFLPLALFSIEEYYKNNQRKYLFLLAFTIPLSFFSGHFQTSLYLLLTVFAYIVYKMLLYKRSWEGVNLFLYTFFGLLLCLPQLLPSLEFYTQTTRSDLFQKFEVIPWGYLPTLISPDFYGNPVTRNDWFGHYAEWNAYAGLLPLMLAVFILIKKKFKDTIFFLILFVVSLLLAYGTPLADFLVALHLPVLSTSASSRVIVLFSFSIAVLSAFGLDQLTSDIGKSRKKAVIFWLSLFFLLFLILWGVVSFKLFLDVSKISIAKSNLILPTSIFIASCIFILSSIFLKNKKLLFVLPFILLAIVSFDLLRFSSKWQSFDPKNLVFVNIPISDYYPNISGFYRVYGNFTAENSVYYHLPSVDGYDPLYVKRYGEFIAFVNSGKFSELARSVVTFPINSSYTQRAVNLLGIKYVLHKVSDGQSVWAFPFWNYPNKYEQIYKDDKFEIYNNKQVFPRAFIVGKYRVIKDDAKILSTLFSNKFMPFKEVIVEQDLNVKQENKIASNVKITKYSADQIEINTWSDKRGLLILTDVFYPGWEAEINGVNTPIYRSDYAFRSIVVPEGKHKIKFSYRPLSYKLGVNLALFGICGIIILGLLNFNKKYIKK
ncbi:MAG: hypothetical protein A2857_05275 [Candidatus Levybacteria bacterium RIFCSPHIGHO2_01_FULL_36_15]|nr:MAG: hypothetical protein A2857_05275 [Candidatus Levybacteria bacterium RIFCSPHIGHO2_01_FULL_36_15]